jgi:hypothetical protein
VARRLGVNRSTVRSWLYRARHAPTGPALGLAERHALADRAEAGIAEAPAAIARGDARAALAAILATGPIFEAIQLADGQAPPEVAAHLSVDHWRASRSAGPGSRDERLPRVARQKMLGHGGEALDAVVSEPAGNRLASLIPDRQKRRAGAAWQQILRHTHKGVDLVVLQLNPAADQLPGFVYHLDEPGQLLRQLHPPQAPRHPAQMTAQWRPL